MAVCSPAYVHFTTAANRGFPLAGRGSMTLSDHFVSVRTMNQERERPELHRELYAMAGHDGYVYLRLHVVDKTS